MLPEKQFLRIKTDLTPESSVFMMNSMRPPAFQPTIMMKRNLIPFTAFLAALVFVACDGGKKQDHPRDVSVPSEQAVPKTPGEKILAVLLLIKDQATANAHAAEVKELAASLPGDIPNEEAVNIANELMRLASRECYGSSSLEDALKGIHFDTGEYTGSVPLDVDGFEPTAEEP